MDSYECFVSRKRMVTNLLDEQTAGWDVEDPETDVYTDYYSEAYTKFGIKQQDGVIIEATQDSSFDNCYHKDIVNALQFYVDLVGQYLYFSFPVRFSVELTRSGYREELGQTMTIWSMSQAEL